MTNSICDFISTKNVSLNQLSCCSSNNCTTNFANCSKPNQLVKCYDIGNMTDACRRTDEIASRVCDYDSNIYCVSNRDNNGTNVQLYPRFFDAKRWAMSRTSFDESLNGSQACYDGKDYYLCPPSSQRELECEDFFRSSYGCLWYIPGSPQGDYIRDNYQGRVCQKSASSPTNTMTSGSNIGGKGSSATDELADVIKVWRVVAIGFTVASFCFAIISLWIRRVKLKLAYKKYRMKKDKSDKGDKGYKEASQSENIELEPRLDGIENGFEVPENEQEKLNKAYKN